MKGKLVRGCLRLSVACKVSSSLSLSLFLSISDDVNDTFLPIFNDFPWSACSNYNFFLFLSYVFFLVFFRVAWKWGEIMFHLAVYFLISVRRARRVNERRSRLTVAFFRVIFFRLRLLINICIFFFLLFVFWDGNMWRREACGGEYVIKEGRRKVPSFLNSCEESRCMWK